MEFVHSKGLPAYSFSVTKRPSLKSVSARKAYKDEVARCAQRHIKTPIDSSDVEVEIFYAFSEPEKSIDVDNVAKPTLDALKGIAYHDDERVRAIRIVRIDKTKPGLISGRIGPLKALLRGKKAHTVWINIYSKSRMDAFIKKFGYKRVWQQRKKHWGIHAIMQYAPSKTRKRTKR